MSEQSRIYWVTVDTMGLFVIHDEEVPDSSTRLLSPEQVKEHREVRKRLTELQVQVLTAPNKVNL